MNSPENQPTYTRPGEVNGKYNATRYSSVPNSDSAPGSAAAKAAGGVTPQAVAQASPSNVSSPPPAMATRLLTGVATAIAVMVLCALISTMSSRITKLQDQVQTMQTGLEAFANNKIDEWKPGVEQRVQRVEQAAARAEQSAQNVSTQFAAALKEMDARSQKAQQDAEARMQKATQDSANRLEQRIPAVLDRYFATRVRRLQQGR